MLDDDGDNEDDEDDDSDGYDDDDDGDDDDGDDDHAFADEVTSDLGVPWLRIVLGMLL